MTSNRIRVLQIATRLNVGGVSTQVLELASRLSPARFDSYVMTGTVGPSEGDARDLQKEVAARLDGRIIDIPELQRTTNPVVDARAFARLSREIRRLQPHVVHTHMAKAGFLGRTAAWRRKVPAIVHTYHGTVFRGYFNPVLSRAVARSEWALSTITDRFVAVSAAVADELRRHHFPNRKIVTIPLGLDLQALAAIPPLDQTKRPIVTAVARVVHIKDIPLLIEAARLARETIPDLTLRIVGDGPLRVTLAASAPEWVEFAGNTADLASELERSAVVALTSRAEGAPAALIEALAAARPVVAVPVGGVDDTIGGRAGALVTADRAPATIARGIVAALRDPLVADGAAAGRAAVVAQFNVESVVGQFESLYTSLVEEGSKKRVRKAARIDRQQRRR